MFFQESQHCLEEAGLSMGLGIGCRVLRQQSTDPAKLCPHSHLVQQALAYPESREVLVRASRLETLAFGLKDIEEGIAFVIR